MPNAGPVVLCGSLSLHPVGLGAAMHTAGYAALGLPWVYVPFAMTSEKLPEGVRAMRALGIRGLGVSMPFKIDVMPLLDRIDPRAARIGAVNTIVRDGESLVGHNTDATGAVRALEEACSDLRGLEVLVLGAGGAARAVVFGLTDAGARVTIANRTSARAEALAEASGARARSWEEALARADGYAAIVQATSAGMDTSATGSSPAPSARDLDALRIERHHVVMDIVYRPVRTELLARTLDAGGRTVHGGRMLLHQAAAQFSLYTGIDPLPSPVLAAMDAALVRSVDSSNRTLATTR